MEGGEKEMKALHMVAFLLTVVGALNWGLVALFNVDLVKVVFGGLGLSTVVYVLVAVSAVYLLLTHKNDCKVCSGK